jgi:PPM family protein phosphatase
MGFLRRLLFGNTSEEAPKSVDQAKKQEIIATTTPPAASPAKPEAAAIAEELEEYATRPLGIKDAETPPPPVEAIEQDKTVRIDEDTTMSAATGYVHLGQMSDVGLVRTNNQDAALSFYARSDSVEPRPTFGLFVVADGMGGHVDGEKASAITTRVLTSYVINEIYLPLHNGGPKPDQPPHTELLVKGVQTANKEVIKQVDDGGTTVTAALVVGNWIHIAHVGDSRAYLINADGIEQITRDHSVVQRLIELDQLTPAEAVNHPRKNVLYRALGQNEALEVDIFTRRLTPNSHILICSDGLWGLLEEKDLYEQSMNILDPQKACEKLVELANIQGGIDNITAILLNVH